MLRVSGQHRTANLGGSYRGVVREVGSIMLVFDKLFGRAGTYVEDMLSKSL